MRVFIYSAGQDTAGQGFRIKTGFERLLPDWEVSARHVSSTYMQYPAESKVPTSRQAAQVLYDAADVVHLRNELSAWERFDRRQGKPLVLHHHGTRFRTNHAYLHSYAAGVGAVQIVSTVDLELLAPGLTWLPAPFPLEPFRQLRAEHYRPADTIRIAHAPTDRRVKSTATVLEAFRTLRAEGLPVDLDIIERRPWTECLERKAQADIYVDQVMLGYGCNAIESWAMGIPVVANAADPAVLRRMRELYDGPLPFFQATEDDMVDRLRELVLSEALRREFGAIGLAHVERHHDERRVIPMLADLYRSAPATSTRPYRQLQRRAVAA